MIEGINVPLTPQEQAEWDAWVAEVREQVVKKMADSASVIQVYSPERTTESPDVKFAVEIGMSFLLDKPILAIVMPGTAVPRKLAQVADKIVYADIDTPEGRETASTAIAEFTLEQGESDAGS